MCGIAGIVQFASRVDAERCVARMVDALGHRGPDGRGIQAMSVGSSRVVLGHTRLAIIDVDARAAQPMSSNEKRLWISYNGEIYNYSDLRPLCLSGRSWNTQCDTEVILRLYEAWGSVAFSLLRGMYAIALIDIEKARAFLIRDPLGIKPLYYSIEPHGVVFASEIRALLAGGVPRRVTESGVASFLQYGSIQEPHTIIDGVKALEPGTLLEIDLCRQSVQLHTDERQTLVGMGEYEGDRDEAIAHVRHLVYAGVRRHLISDVPVGIFLSGGIDSSVVVAGAARASAAPPVTFTICCAGFNEEDVAASRRIARYFKCTHHEIKIDDNSVADLFEDAMNALDQPSMDGINTYVVARTVRQHGISVALSGLGGDELFGGYPSFGRAKWLVRLRRLPAAVRYGGVGISRVLGFREHWHMKLRELLMAEDASAVYEVSRRLFSDRQVRWLGAGDGVADAKPCGVAGTGDVFNAVSYLELTGYMRNTLLRDTDAMAMASSLEVRVPLVDLDLVRFVLRLPGSWKDGLGGPKGLLREAMEPWLPEWVWRRKKRGFVLPFQQWLRSTLNEDVQRVLKDRDMLGRVGLKGEGVRAQYESWLAGRSPWSHIWALYVLCFWAQRQDCSV